MANSVDLAALCAAFGQRLHDQGVPVTPERSARFAQVVQLARPVATDELYWLARVTLTCDNDQFATFDRVFRMVFRGMVDLAELRSDDPQEQSGAVEAASPEEQPPGAQQSAPDRQGDPPGTSASPGAADMNADVNESSVLAAVSVDERLNDREFSALTEDELALIRKLVERLPLVPPLRRGRRANRSIKGSDIDVRSTLRRAHRTAGDPVRLTYRKPSAKPRKIILIADVSGSMEPYARIYLHLLRGAVKAIRAEAFVFATHLTHLTRQLSGASTESAYQKAAAAANDWSGGTRIGRAIKTFIDDFGRRGMARGAVVVIVSDGWESDRPELLAEAMEQLSRLAHHIIWVNPRKAAASFEPLTGGMAAALPYVDTFLSGHSLRALQEVMDAIAAAGDRVDRTTQARARIAS